MSADHEFPGEGAPCAPCGVPFAVWMRRDTRCVPEPEPPHDPLWDAIVAVATGTNAADPPGEEEKRDE